MTIQTSTKYYQKKLKKNKKKSRKRYQNITEEKKHERENMVVNAIKILKTKS